MKKIIPFLIVALFCLRLPAAAAANGSTGHLPSATVVDVYLDGNALKKSGGIGDVIVVNVANFKSLLHTSPDSAVNQVRLFISCQEIRDCAPIGWCMHGDGADLKFLLQRTDTSNKTWNTLLGYPLPGKEFFDLPFDISVGMAGKAPVALKHHLNKFSFSRIDRGWFLGCLLFLVGYFWILRHCATKTTMLQDAPTDLSPLGITGVTASNSPFSLGKVQMAFWFSIILTSYVFIWLVTDDYDILNSGTLILIGIGAGTGLGAISIGNNKNDATIAKIQALQKQQSDLRQANQILQAEANAGNDAKIQYNNFLDGQLTANIKDLIASLTVTKGQFFNDLLTDVNGVSFHRLQMLVFTVVLGLVFIYSVYENLTMPNFSGTLLTMQGITAGTYLGFKFPEKQG